MFRFSRLRQMFRPAAIQRHLHPRMRIAVRRLGQIDQPAIERSMLAVLVELDREMRLIRRIRLAGEDALGPATQWRRVERDVGAVMTNVAVERAGLEQDDAE